MEQFVLLLKEIEEALHNIEKSEICIQDKAQDATSILMDAFTRMKAFAFKYKFRSESEEIFFFKEIKPKVFYNQIYYCKVYDIEMNRPLAMEDMQIDYLKLELNRVNNFLNENSGFHQYYRLGNTYLDRFYFLRKTRILYGMKDVLENLESIYFEHDPCFSTNCDFKLAKILASEQIQNYLNSELKTLGMEMS